jgi:hypothetical protein
VVCLDRPLADLVLVPCGHRCLCLSCASSHYHYQQQPSPSPSSSIASSNVNVKCPMCRVVVSQCLRIYSV